MADIQSIAEELVGLSVREVQELAMVMKDEYGIEPISKTPKMEECRKGAVLHTSPKQYGMKLLGKKRV